MTHESGVITVKRSTRRGITSRQVRELPAIPWRRKRRAAAFSAIRHVVTVDENVLNRAFHYSIIPRANGWQNWQPFGDGGPWQGENLTAPWVGEQPLDRWVNRRRLSLFRARARRRPQGHRSPRKLLATLTSTRHGAPPQTSSGVLIDEFIEEITGLLDYSTESARSAGAACPLQERDERLGFCWCRRDLNPHALAAPDPQV